MKDDGGQEAAYVKFTTSIGVFYQNDTSNLITRNNSAVAIPPDYYASALSSMQVWQWKK